MSSTRNQYLLQEGKKKMNVFKKLSLLTVSAVMAVTLAACNNTAKDILSKQGNIIGDPLVGDFNEKRAEEILKMVDDINQV